MKFRIVLLFIVWLQAINPLTGCATSQDRNPSGPLSPKEYVIVTHNIENLFDADSIAAYDDYKPFDKQGNVQYSNTHLLNKIQNTVRLMQQYNDGRGPDVLMAVEVEADHTRGSEIQAKTFLDRWSSTTLVKMLGEDFTKEIADLPSELLLLKGFWDAGMKEYDVATIEPDPAATGRPSSVIKNVVFSRIPIMHEKTKAHPTVDARPILEVWLDVDGSPLVTFTNHWKSGASNAETEQTRIQNAQVLRARVNELLVEDPSIDFVIGGDLNSDYNQIQRYTSMFYTGINSVLQTTGDEYKVSQGSQDVYNLWYELPVDQRRSDSYFEYWGTLMHLIVSPGMYNRSGVYYVDNSFSVGAFAGLNANAHHLAPFRWTSALGGLGYSDHFPLSMTIASRSPESGPYIPTNPGVENDDTWKPIKVDTHRPPDALITRMEASRAQEYLTATYYDAFLEVTATVKEDGSLRVGTTDFTVYSPTFRAPQVLSSQYKPGETVTFVGRLSNFRGTWQFIIDDRSFIQPKN
jgi:endonuclease/exonuclease/phosphatase family metal-dependent hydrolase